MLILNCNCFLSKGSSICTFIAHPFCSLTINIFKHMLLFNMCGRKFLLGVIQLKRTFRTSPFCSGLKMLARKRAILTNGYIPCQMCLIPHYIPFPSKLFAYTCPPSNSCPKVCSSRPIYCSSGVSTVQWHATCPHRPL